MLWHSDQSENDPPPPRRLKASLTTLDFIDAFKHKRCIISCVIVDVRMKSVVVHSLSRVDFSSDIVTWVLRRWRRKRMYICAQWRSKRSILKWMQWLFDDPPRKGFCLRRQEQIHSKAERDIHCFNRSLIYTRERENTQSRLTEEVEPKNDDDFTDGEDVCAVQRCSRRL